MLKYLIQTSIFRYSKNYGSLTHENRIKDAVNMGDLICLLATVRTLNHNAETCFHKFELQCRSCHSFGHKANYCSKFWSPGHENVMSAVICTDHVLMLITVPLIYMNYIMVNHLVLFVTMYIDHLMVHPLVLHVTLRSLRYDILYSRALQLQYYRRWRVRLFAGEVMS